MFTAVLSRGSSGDTEEPAGTGKGTGTQRKDRCSGGSGDLGGGRREPGGSGLAAGGAAQGRGCPPPATRRHLWPGPLRHGRSGPGLSRSALQVVEGQGELLAGQPGCARSLCRGVFWRGQACSDEPGLKAGDGAVLQDQLPAVALDRLGRSEIQRQAPEVLDHLAVRAEDLIQGAPDGSVRADFVAGDQGAAV